MTLAAGGEPRASSLAIAQGTENDHASVIKLVRTYAQDLEEFGLLDFKSESSGGRPTEFALLNEQQATLPCCEFLDTPRLANQPARRFCSILSESAGILRAPEPGITGALRF